MFKIGKVNLSKTLIGWIIVVTILTILSVYNVYSVLDEYINDNRITEVTVKPLDNVYPMVPSMSVYYKFTDKAVFPETWTMSEHELDQLLPTRPPNRTMPPDGWPAIRRLAKRKDKAAFGETAGKLPLDSLIDIAVINDIVYEMDHRFLKCGHDIGKNMTTVGDNETETVADPDNCAAYTGELSDDQYPFAINDSSLRPRISSVVDAFIKSDYGVKYAMMAVSHVLNSDRWGKRYQGPHATGTISDVDAVTPVADALGPFGMQINIPFDFIANVTSSDPDPFFGVIPASGNMSQFPQVEKVSFWIGELPMRSSTETRYYIDTQTEITSNEEQVQWFIYFQKIDIFDSTDLSDEDKCSVCGKLQTVNECVFKCKIDAVIDDCGCVPFSYWRLYANDSSGRREKPYCTSEDYRSCYQSAKYKPSRCRGDRYVPCLMTESNYRIWADSEPRKEVFHKFNLRIFWDKSAYTIFEDQLQNNWMQMLGQLGGNLGIFLSFSLLGVWDFLMFLIKYYKKRREKGSPKDGPGLLSSWLQSTQFNNDDSATEVIVQEEVERQVDILRARIKDISGKYASARNENARLRSTFKDVPKLQQEGREDPPTNDETKGL